MFDGRTKVYDMATQREEAVFIALHPFHKDSPLRNPSRHESVFRIANLIGRAQANIEEVARKRKLTEIILNAPDELAIFTAMGFKAGLNRVPQEEARHPTTAKAGLLKLAEKMPGEVLSAFESHKVQVTGAILYALHMGYVQKAQVAGGRFIWRWSAEKGGRDILTTRPRKDAVSEMVEHLSDRELWLEFQEGILPSVKNVREEATKIIEEAKEMVDSGPTDAEIIQQALEEVVVTLHPEEDKIYILNDRDQIDGKALMVLEGPRENWKEEFKERASRIHINRLKSRMS